MRYISPLCGIKGRIENKVLFNMNKTLSNRKNSFKLFRLSKTQLNKEYRRVKKAMSHFKE